MSDTSWTDERVAELKRHWELGTPASAISAEMGGISRSGVLGKAHRLNLSGRSRNPHPRKQPPLVERPPPLNEGRARPPRRRSQPPAGTTMQRTIIRPARAGGCDEVETVMVPEAIDLPPDESEFKCSILELGDAQCRWPLGDPGKPDFGFCGDAAVGGKPYCTRHHRLAHKANHYRGDWK
jgi:GcrA cell cycle regulator